MLVLNISKCLIFGPYICKCWTLSGVQHFVQLRPLVMHISVNGKIFPTRRDRKQSDTAWHHPPAAIQHFKMLNTCKCKAIIHNIYTFVQDLKVFNIHYCFETFFNRLNTWTFWSVQHFKCFSKWKLLFFASIILLLSEHY